MDEDFKQFIIAQSSLINDSFNFAESRLNTLIEKLEKETNEEQVESLKTEIAIYVARINFEKKEVARLEKKAKSALVYDSIIKALRNSKN